MQMQAIWANPFVENLNFYLNKFVSWTFEKKPPFFWLCLPFF